MFYVLLVLCALSIAWLPTFLSSRDAFLVVVVLLGTSMIVAIVSRLWQRPHPGIGLAILVATVPLRSLLSWSVGGVQIGLTEPAAVFALAWLVLFRRSGSLPLPRLLVVAGLFLGWIAVSASWGSSSAQSFKEVAKWAQFAVALLITMDLARRPADLKLVAVVAGLIVCSEALVSSVMAILGIGPASFRVGGIVRAFGTFEQPNPFAGYLALHLPFAVAGLMVWRGRLRGAVFLILLLILSALIFSLSRGGWIAGSLGLLAVLWMLPIKVPRIFLRSLFVIGFFVALVLLWRGNTIFPSETSSILSGEADLVTLVTKHSEADFAVKQRLAFWMAGIGMVIDYPLTGIGIGNYAARYPDYKIGPWTESIGHAHNLYIHLAAETGLIGLGLFVIFLTWLIVHVAGFRSIADSDQVMLVGATGSIVAFSIHNIVDSLFVGGLGIMFGVIVGLALGVCSSTTTAQHNI